MTRPTTTAQALRVHELADLLREDHGDAVQVRGARVTVKGSRIAATVEPDCGLWRTWADGTRAYEPPTAEQYAAATCGREGCDGLRVPGSDRCSAHVEQDHPRPQAWPVSDSEATYETWLHGESRNAGEDG